MEIILEIMIPFFGTSLGALFVFFVKEKIKESFHKILLGTAAGIMMAASMWSLLLPALSMSEPLGKLAFVPATAGFFAGNFFLLLLDGLLLWLEKQKTAAGDGERESYKKVILLVFVIVLHNIPEGMAVGASFSGNIHGGKITAAAAVALAVGIALQNIPEGALISIPLKNSGMGRGKSFLCGVLSGAVEPAAAVLTLVLTGGTCSLLPLLLAGAAGAMIYMTIKELVPEALEGSCRTGIISFSVGFVLMMVLDTAL